MGSLAGNQPICRSGLAGPGATTAAVPQPLQLRQLQRPLLLLGPLRLRLPVLLLFALILWLLPSRVWLLRLERFAALSPLSRPRFDVSIASAQVCIRHVIEAGPARDQVSLFELTRSRGPIAARYCSPSERRSYFPPAAPVPVLAPSAYSAPISTTLQHSRIPMPFGLTLLVSVVAAFAEAMRRRHEPCSYRSKQRPLGPKLVRCS
jgi:hypothetical protein